MLSSQSFLTVESWVELSMSGAVNKTSGQSTPSLERLLVDAQKESGLTSRNSSGPNRYVVTKIVPV